jgi:hypothetical protein
MGIIAIWKHLTEQSRASSPCLEVAFRILLAGDPYIWCVQRGGGETHGKQVLYVRGTSLASANQTPSAAFVVPRFSDSDRVRYIRSYRGNPLLVRSRGLKPYLASLTTVTTFGR